MFACTCGTEFNGFPKSRKRYEGIRWLIELGLQMGWEQSEPEAPGPRSIRSQSRRNAVQGSLRAMKIFGREA